MFACILLPIQTNSRGKYHQVSPGDQNTDTRVAWLRSILRICIVLLTIFITIGLSLILRLLLIPFPHSRYVGYNTRLLINPVAKLLFRIVNIRIRTHGRISPHNQIVVANHLGYLDSLLLMSLSPCLVISSTEVRSKPIIGWVMDLFGHVFVDRRHHTSILETMGPVREMLQRSCINTGFFPEGWSGNGLELGEFHSPFFQLAVGTGADIQPLVFQMVKINGHKVGLDDLPLLIYRITDGSVVNHVFRFLRIKALEIEVHILEPITGAEIALQGFDRKAICHLAEERVRDAFRGIGTN